MFNRTHIPALDREHLIVALQEIDALPIDPAAKRQLKDILRAAANPDTEKIETIIKSLPKERQAEIWRIFEEVAVMQQKQADDAARVLLLLGVLSLANLVAAYLLAETQEALTAAQILEQMKRVYVSAIQDEVNYCGCTGRARNPSGADLEHLREMATDDATSIINTYNKNATNKLMQLYKDNPTASRDFFIESMRAWIDDRAVWKSLQIAANTEFRAREYARNQFRLHNYPSNALYRFTGPVPVCKLCVTQFAEGLVTLEHVQAHLAPLHLLCPHSWSLLRKPKIDCQNLWVG